MAEWTFRRPPDIRAPQPLPAVLLPPYVAPPDVVVWPAPIQAAVYLRPGYSPAPYQLSPATWLLLPALATFIPSPPSQAAAYLRVATPQIQTLPAPWIPPASLGDRPPSVGSSAAAYLRPSPAQIQRVPPPASLIPPYVSPPDVVVWTVPLQTAVYWRPSYAIAPYQALLPTWLLVPAQAPAALPPVLPAQLAPYLRIAAPQIHTLPAPWIPPASLGDRPPAITSSAAAYVRPTSPQPRSSSSISWLLVPSAAVLPPQLPYRIAPYIRFIAPVGQAAIQSWQFAATGTLIAGDPRYIVHAGVRTFTDAIAARSFSTAEGARSFTVYFKDRP